MANQRDRQSRLGRADRPGLDGRGLGGLDVFGL